MAQAATSATADMLAEIESSTAEQMLMAVGYSTAPPGPTFLPELDEAILQLRPHPGGSSLQRGDLMEIVGASGSGKTSTLVFLLSTFLLPQSIPFPQACLPAVSTSQQPDDVECGGRHSSCVVLQPSTHSSILPRLSATLTGHLYACLSTAVKAQPWWTAHPQQLQALDDEVHTVVQSSLGRLEIVRLRPRWRSWALGLRRIVELPPLLVDSQIPSSVGLVVCDGFGDAFYPEKWADEQARFVRTSGAPTVTPGSLKGLRSMDDVGLPEVFSAITSIRQHLGSVVVLSVQGLWKLNETPYYSSHLPPPYPRPFARRDAQSNPPPVDKWPLNIQLTLQPPSKPLQFPPESLASEALRSTALANLNQYGEFIGYPRTRITGRVRVNGPRSLAVDSGEGVKFAFAIGPEGVEAWQ